MYRLPAGYDCHSPSDVQSAAPTAQQGVVGESSARNILNILQQKEVANKTASQAGNVPPTPQQGEYVVCLSAPTLQCQVAWNVQLRIKFYFNITDEQHRHNSYTVM